MFGLINYGSTCYLNSVLQSFLNNDLFILKLKNINEKTPLLYLIKKLKFSELNKNHYLQKIINLIHRQQNIQVFDENDAHELLLIILSIIENEDKEIYYLFVGIKYSIILCDKCNYINKTKEEFNTLHFYLRESTNLKKLIKEEFNREIIHNCICEKCNNNYLISQKYIHKFPDVLIILNCTKVYKIYTEDYYTLTDIDGNIINYDKFCCINHYGGLQNGHYTYSDGNYEINDDKITKDVNDDKNNYIIIYIKLN